MELMSISEVADFLGVQNQRVERLERESLLMAKSKDNQGCPMFDSKDVKQFKQFADRLGGI